MTSLDAYPSLSLPPQKPRILKSPLSKGHYGDSLKEFHKAINLNLFDWQEFQIEQLFSVAVDSDKWACTEAGSLCARQNGKGEVLAAYAIDHLFIFPRPDNKPKTILYSAHEYKTAEEGFRRIKGIIEASPALMSKVEHIYDSSGKQEIILKPRKGQVRGDRLKFISRAKNSGRGFTADVLILDEAQELSVASYDSLMYTQTTIPNPQVFMVGTVPDESNDCEVFTGLRDRGRSPSGENPTTLWMEYSPEGAEDYEQAQKIDASDPKLWGQANPSMIQLIPIETIQEQYERDTSASKESFKRERLSIWSSRPPEEETTLNDIDLEAWESTANPRALHGENLVLSVQVADNGGHASISACSQQPDGTYYVEHITTQLQTRWVSGKLKSLMSELGAVSLVLDEKKCASIIPDLKREKIKFFSARPSEIAGAFSLFVELANDRQLIHRGQASLTESLKKAIPRKVGSYGFTWDASDPQEPVTPTQSATLALFGCINYLNIKPKRGVVRGIR